MEESYREYHKTAYSAAAVHPAEAKEEALKIQAAMCSLIGLSPPADSAGCNDDDTAVSPSVLPAEIVEAVLDGGGGGEGQEAKVGSRQGDEKIMRGGSEAEGLGTCTTSSPFKQSLVKLTRTQNNV